MTGQKSLPKLHSVRRYILDGGERFVTVVDAEGAPSYYATCLLLARRSQNVTADTLAAEAQDLVHLGQWAFYEGIDLDTRLEAGRYLTRPEMNILADACGIKIKAFRRRASRTMKLAGLGKTLTRSDFVSNGCKFRRLTTAASYIDLVASMSEAALSRRQVEFAERTKARLEMVAYIKKRRPDILSSRVRGVVPADELARVVAFIVTADPSTLWANEAVRLRNWAMLNVLVECGLRQGEERQLKLTDVDFQKCQLTVYRRHDDPDDPRIREPNAKTFDRIIPFSTRVARCLQAYVLGPGSDAAEKQASPFLFLTHDRATFGRPISGAVVAEAVTKVGDHLGIPGLTPHDLRHAWIQEFALWATEAGVPAHEFDRYANALGGWSYVSRMATEYRSDQLTAIAYERGLKVQGERT